VVPTSADRRIGALAHLGVPIYGFILPLVVWAVAKESPFRRAHARQAFSFQVGFIAVWVVGVVLMALGTLSPLVLLALLGVGFVAELPQVARALRGQPPLRLIPFEVLRP